MLEQAQGIQVGPLFGDLAVHNLEEIGAGKRHVLPRWRKTLKGSLLRAAPGVSDRYLVPLGDQVLSGELEVGEGGGEFYHQHFGLLDASNGLAAREV